MTRVLVVTFEPLGPRMAGPAIRAWHMAGVLSARHDVRLATLSTADRTADSFSVERADDARLRELERWADVIVFQGGLLRVHPWLKESDRVLVGDVYDPFHLENLEQTRGQPLDQRRDTITHLTGVLNEQLERCDFLLCASRRQRDFWLGALAALGRVNPDTYDADETLRSLLAVVPFGVPVDGPAQSRHGIRGGVPGITEGDAVLLWAGGVYNWLDPLTLVRAVDIVRRRVENIRLFFLGLQHPNPDIPEMRVATELRRLSDELALTGRHVFFNEGWVPYDERADYLLDADIGVTTHHVHVETEFSFRTRVLDYLWAGLPVVTTEGDDLADLVADHGAGAAVPPGDADALAAALERLLADDDGRARAAERSRSLGEQFRWPDVLRPLVDFCDKPTHAPDLAPARPPRERSAESGGARTRTARMLRAVADRLAP